MKKEISIILPIHNEKDSLPIMIRLLNSSIKFTKEIIIVYDTEKENALNVAKELSEEFENVKLIHNTKTKGVKYAVDVGIQNAKYDVVMIFAVDEIFAGAALRVLRGLKKAIPKDVGLICFTDGLISKYSYPSLTTVKQHAEEIGKVAAGKLIERLENDNEDFKYEQKVIKSVIIEREST